MSRLHDALGADSIYSASYQMKYTIAQATDELCALRPLAKITVGQICDHAGVARQTFYKHFSTKSDIAAWMVDSITAEHFARIGPRYSWAQAFSDIAATVRSHKHMLLESSLDLPDTDTSLAIQANTIAKHLCDIIIARGVEMTPHLSDLVTLFSEFYVTSFVSGCRSERLRALSCEEIGELLASFVPRELHEVLGVRFTH